MQIQELVNVGGKTTMRIGGQARYYAEPEAQQDVEELVRFAREKNIPLIPLGSGANTVFTDGVVEALVFRVKPATVEVNGNTVTVASGKNLAMLINELAKQNLDLSALTGIPGTMGGALFGNAGQGAGGIWLDTYIVDVTAYIDGQWKTLSREDCKLRYRESLFKDLAKPTPDTPRPIPPVIWSMTLNVPSKPQAEVEAEVQRLLQKRIETQPHLKTAGSCFKTVGDTPAWKLVDAAGLRGFKVGDVEVAEKHANFLLNKGAATYADAKKMVEEIRKKVPVHLEVEMRFVEPDGTLAF